MARTPLKLHEMIDAAALRQELTELTAASDGNGSGVELRATVLARLKAVLSEGHTRAETMLLADGGGSACAARLSHLMDEIISVLYDFATHHVYRSQNPSQAERMAIVAVGGYGRGTLAPGSDIDLLFLLPYKQTPWGEQVIEYILYMMWDMGLKVGHATRNIDECVRLSRTDITIRTAVLEARFLWGDEPLFGELLTRFDKEVVKGTASEFVQAKLAERDVRHTKQGESRYKVEPNIKEGKGGLRDLQTLFWIGKYHYRVATVEELVGKAFTRQEFNIFRRAEDFLWAVRCHMHFVTGKAEERLHFELQRDVAARLNYHDTPGLSFVERFMKHYFLVAKDVGDLTRIVCAALEEEQAKHVPGFNRLFSGFTKRKRKLPGTTDFIIDNDRITIANDKVFEKDPLNLVRLFWFADRHGLEYHPDAMQLLSRSLKLVNRDLRRNPEGNALFMDVLTGRDPELHLRRMNEAGLLGKLIPDFRKIVAMMQFSMYHHYTVDEHLLRCIGVLSSIEQGREEKAHPLAHRLIPDIKANRRILYTAVLLHDIAKGRPEDHSIAGARIARRLGPHMGLDAQETETVAWLVEQHLTMSTVAQSRDLNDRKTIEDFAAVVQSVDRLRMLLVLTICDIRGVGPGVWNGWKGQLLRTLYAETELLMTGGFSEASRKDRVEMARERLSARLADWPEAERNAYCELHYPAYLLAVDIEDQVRHAAFIRKNDQAGKRLATTVRTLEFEAITEITVLTPDHPRLLSMIAGACAAAGANIVDAQIFTTSDGRALDTIFVTREFDQNEDELRRAARVSHLIEEALEGRTRLPEMIEKRAKPKKRNKAFRIPPAVEIRNTLSRKFSVIEVEGLDRTGLLSELTGALADLSLDIASAHITTFGEKVVDTFYVTDLVGHKIENPTRQAKIEARLKAVLDESPTIVTQKVVRQTVAANMAGKA